MPDIDEQDERIVKILSGGDKIPEVNGRTLARYLAHIKANLKVHCHLTGTEDFSWEERFVFGDGNKAEYKELKMTRASYTDTFELLGFDKELSGFRGILANVRRISDRKTFILPLADLKPTDELSENHQLLDDYSVWFFNNR